jgi:hypothetical protein
MSIRNLVLAGTLVLGAALSTGTANASPAANLVIGVPTTGESAVTQAYHGGYQQGYGNYLCRVPFFVLVKRFGFWRAKMIKRSCYRPYYYYNNYSY